MLPLIYTSPGAAVIFLAACLIWDVPEVIVAFRRKAKVSRKDASIQDRGSLGILIGLLPEHVITNYNTCMRWSRREAPRYAYLFWGAEYWMLRKKCADSSYLQAFARILERA